MPSPQKRSKMGTGVWKEDRKAEKGRSCCPVQLVGTAHCVFGSLYLW